MDNNSINNATKTDLIESQDINNTSTIDISINENHQLIDQINNTEPTKLESPNTINETIQVNLTNSTSKSISSSNNLINTREKRIRKQKSFDDDFVLFNLSSSYYTNSSFSSIVNHQNNFKILI
jgi:hypothetical protein